MAAETILVVDDEQQIRQLTELILKTAGYRVYTAAGAADAIAIARQLQCSLNLLLTDMLMPGMDGHELIRTIRRVCSYMDVLAMSGALSADDGRERHYHVLPKPFTAAELLNSVKAVLATQLRF